MARKWQSVRSRRAGPLIGGVLSLAVAMGIGRFAYTPLLPAMQRSLHWSVGFSGLVASANYVGYLVGALVAGALPVTARWSRLSWVIVGLFGVSLSVGAMGFGTHAAWWLIGRGLAGIFSAWVLVFTSSLLLDWFAAHGDTRSPAQLYAGVGLGIVLTGIVGPWLSGLGGWHTGWIGLGVGSLVLSGVTVRLLRPVTTPPPPAAVKRPPSSHADPSPRLWGLVVAYGLEGLGYVIMATFITTFFGAGAQAIGNISWILVGLAAVPSTVVWAGLARRWGSRTALSAAFGVEALGVVLPVLGANAAASLVGAVLFGGTFMGITAQGLAIAGTAAPASSHRIMGRMTAAFGLGQLIGPLGVAGLAGHPHGLTVSLLSSAGLLAGAGVLFGATYRPPSAMRSSKRRTVG